MRLAGLRAEVMGANGHVRNARAAGAPLRVGCNAFYRIVTGNQFVTSMAKAISAGCCSGSEE